MPKQKKPRGRPPKLEMPDRIPDTPENVAKAVLNTPPKKREDWDFIKRSKPSP